jgi:biotin operon repressor
MSFVSRNQTLRQTQNAKNFDALPKKFTVEQVESTLNISRRAAWNQIARWKDKGYIESKGKEFIKK